MHHQVRAQENNLNAVEPVVNRFEGPVIRDLFFPPHFPGATFDKLTKAADSLWMRALLATAYAFGFRKSELVEMKVAQINLIDKTITLYRGETKSGEPRLVAMTQDVYLLLAECIHGKDQDDFVFTRGRESVKDMRDAWEKLTAAAGCPELLLHHLRRSAVRNMIRRGMPERVAMQISGHKTRSVFDRYNIVSQNDLVEAARKIEAGQKTVQPAPNEFGYSLAKVGTQLQCLTCRK